ncbi:MAG TPA: helix-turn-helix domain-containing protein, partial [Verrucomicrobiae bacterium]|nr:helix-turn-helix domain-containing protein [Verrucomicrobiae bacterium]
EGGILEPAHLGLGQSAAMSAAFPSSSAVTSRATNGFGSAESAEFPPLSEVEKRHILAALEQSKGNRTHAAKVLGISIRTLRNKLNEYNYRGAEPASARD